MPGLVSQRIHVQQQQQPEHGYHHAQRHQPRAAGQHGQQHPQHVRAAPCPPREWEWLLPSCARVHPLEIRVAFGLAHAGRASAAYHYHHAIVVIERRWGAILRLIKP